MQSIAIGTQGCKYGSVTIFHLHFLLYIIQDETTKLSVTTSLLIAADANIVLVVVIAIGWRKSELATCHACTRIYTVTMHSCNVHYITCPLALLPHSPATLLSSEGN